MKRKCLTVLFIYFRNIMSVTDKIIPKVHAEEEEEPEEEEEDEEEDLVDPADAIKENCGTEHCQKYMERQVLLFDSNCVFVIRIFLSHTYIQRMHRRSHFFVKQTD